MNILKKYTFSLGAMLLAHFVFAQTGNIEGTVKDSTGKAIEAATVVLQQKNTSVFTDNKGNYSIKNIAEGNYTLSATLVGYSTQSKQINIKAGQTVTADFNLIPSVNELNTVTINGVSAIKGMGYLNEVHSGVIYAGQKNEVLILDSLTANTAQNNPRQVLGRVPGANYSETEGNGFPSNGIGFRGLNPTQSIEVNTRQDGYNITADLYGYPESYYLPPLEAVKRVEIIRGAASLQFGPQFGGVINYIIKDGPENKPFQFTTEETGGSFGLLHTFNSFGGTVGKVNYYVFIQAEHSSGWRPNSDVSQLMSFAHIEYKASNKFKVGLEYSLLRNTIHMPGGLDDAEFNKNANQSFRARNWLTSPWNILALTAEYKASARTMFTIKSALNLSGRSLVWRNEDGGPQTPDSISPVTGTYVSREVEHEGFNNSTTELRMLTNYTIAGKAQTLAAGVRFFYGTMKRQEGGPGSTGTNFDLNLYGGTYEKDLDFTTVNAAPFVENIFRIGTRFSVTPGFRYEYIKSNAAGYVTNDDSLGTIINVSHSQAWYIPLAGVGLQYNTSETSNIYANISQAYRPIDYSNQYPIGSDSKVDPNLSDINGYNAETGWRGSFKNYLHFDVGGFYMAYNNGVGIETLTDASGNPYTYITNVADNVHKGIETYVELNVVKLFTQHSKIGGISFFNSYAYDDARYVKGPFKGNYVEFAPSGIERLGITYELKHFSTTFLISSTSQSYADANNTIYSPDAEVGIIPAYTVVDWSAAIEIKRYNLKFGINNLGNAKYFTLRTSEYPGPGIIPSEGRSFYIGVGAKF